MDRAERNELVEKNIGLVHACANKFRGKGVEYDDLFQAGCVGIIKPPKTSTRSADSRFRPMPCPSFSAR